MEIILQMDGYDEELKWKMSENDAMAKVLLGYYMFNESIDDLRTDPRVINWVKENRPEEFAVAEIPDEATDWYLDTHRELDESCWDALFYALDGKIHHIFPRDIRVKTV